MDLGLSSTMSIKRSFAHIAMAPCPQTFVGSGHISGIKLSLVLELRDMPAAGSFVFSA